MICALCAEFYERTVAQRYEGYRIIAAFAICIVGSPLLILFIVSFITGMTRFFQRRINYTQHCISNFRGETGKKRERANSAGHRAIAIGSAKVGSSRRANTRVYT